MRRSVLLGLIILIALSPTPTLCYLRNVAPDLEPVCTSTFAALIWRLHSELLQATLGLAFRTGSDSDGPGRRHKPHLL